MWEQMKCRVRTEFRSTEGKEPGIEGVPKMLGQILGINSPQQSREKFLNSLFP